MGSLFNVLKCPRGGLHVFRFGICANCRVPEVQWRKRSFARTTLIAPRREHG